jgi:hypothetical protein
MGTAEVAEHAEKVLLCENPRNLRLKTEELRLSPTVVG